MSAKYDSVLTVAIGRRGTDGKNLSYTEWDNFREEVQDELVKYGKIVGSAEGIGETTDQGQPALEDTMIWIVVLTDGLATDEDPLRVALAQILPRYRQASACFSVQWVHRPVFAAKTPEVTPSPWPAPSASAQYLSPNHRHNYGYGIAP